MDVGKNVAELPCEFSLFVFIFFSQSVRILCFQSMESWVRTVRIMEDFHLLQVTPANASPGRNSRS